jgi:hypothetical protein
MRARQGAAARLRRAGMVALVLGVGAFALPNIETRSRATAQPSWENRPSLIMMPDREVLAASSYVQEQLRTSVPRDADSDAWAADLRRQIGRSCGVVSVNIDQCSPPLFVMPADQPTARVRAAMVSYARIQARAAQKYGVVVRDTTGAVVLDAENPLLKGADHPYSGVGDILRSAKGRVEAARYADSSNRLRRWGKFELILATLPTRASTRFSSPSMQELV